MFDVHNGKLYYENYPVGTIAGAPWKGLEIAAVDALRDWVDPTDLIDSATHQNALDEMEKEAYKNGLGEGEEAGRAKCESEMREEWERDAFAAGRDSALADASLAAQTRRVDALLAALAKAHDALFTIRAKRYPAAKIKECKDAMHRAESILRSAQIDYRHDPAS